MTRNSTNRNFSMNADPDDFQAQFFKTSMCRFQQGFGECRRGASCTFAHRREELRSSPDLRKTSLCRQWQFEGECSNPTCRFAHRMGELSSTFNFFRKKPCTFFSRGRCISGESCRFSHEETSDKDGEFAEIDSGYEQDGSDDAVDTDGLQDKAQRKNRHSVKKKRAQNPRGSRELGEMGVKLRSSRHASMQQRTHGMPMAYTQIPSNYPLHSSHIYQGKPYGCPVPQYNVPTMEPTMIPHQFVHTQAGMQQVVIPVSALPVEGGNNTIFVAKNVGANIYQNPPPPQQQLIQLPDGTLGVSCFVPVLPPSNAHVISTASIPNQYISSAPPSHVQWPPQYTQAYPSYALPNPQSNGAPLVPPPMPPLASHRFIGSPSYVQPLDSTLPTDFPPCPPTSLGSDVPSPEPEP
eukprot:GEMP01007830.1.p1 GENE.GEMP01007830.1~~GEMP01007830.1.p1  ORF type:complete len:408 (+),score=97.87 GEMP01007830.1:156-1379(+)